MKRAVSVDQARAAQELLKDTETTGSEVLIEQDGEPVDILMSPLQLHGLMRSRERFWELVDAVEAQYPELHEDIAMLIALEAVQKVREERAQHEHGNGGGHA